MFLTRLFAVCLAFALATVGAQADGPGKRYPVWVLSNGFHTAFAFRTDSAPPSLRQVAREARAGWVLVGWGDKQYFMAEKGNLWITIQAVCWPTPSALHVIPVKRPPEYVYRNTEIIRLEMRREQLLALHGYVEGAFFRNRQGGLVRLGPGFSRDSVFFLGSEKFYFPKMCNWWVAAGMRRAGFRVRPACAITAHELARQARKHGKRVGGLKLPVDGF